MSVSCNRSVVFSSLLHQLNWPAQYNWNIVESGINHHNPSPPMSKVWLHCGSNLQSATFEMSTLLSQTWQIAINKFYMAKGNKEK